jgi:hypothetical protein
MLSLYSGRRCAMGRTADTQQKSEPLVELAPDEAVVQALAQGGPYVKFVESNKSEEELAESDES